MKTSFSRLSIRGKLLATAVEVAACALALVVIALLAATFLMVRRSIRSDLAAHAAIIADNTAAALAFNDQAAAAQTLRALRAVPDIDAACLFDASGRLFAVFPRQNAPLCAAAEAHASGEHAGWRSTSITVPVTEGANRYGTVYLHRDLDDLYARLQFQAGLALLALVGGSLVAFVLARRLHHLIADPILILADTASRISREHDYSLRAAKMSEDEVGALVDTFNDMLSEIERRETALSRASAEKTRLLARERETNRLKDEFLAALSHELRTPLNAILGWTQILQRRLPADDKAQQGLASIDRNVRAQARMIEDLLEVSRIITGKLRLKTAAVDLAAVAGAAADVVRPAAAAKNIRLTRTVGGGPYLVSGDADRLQQVVWNLASNAVKFTPPGGAVDIRIEAADGDWQLLVSDTGIGIAPEFLPHIFDRFRQADGSTTREHGGLGLGLSIVRDVVELHGGTVEAASEGPGRGTTLRVRLPRLRRAGRGVADRIVGGDPDRARLAGLSVLVVDDEADAREIAADALKAAGAEVVAAASPDEALDVFERQRFDALVCDIGMPGLDGYGLLRRLRSRQASGARPTPAVAMTAYAAPDDRARASEAGFDAHVAKPFDLSQLVAAVAAVAGRPAASPTPE